MLSYETICKLLKEAREKGEIKGDFIMARLGTIDVEVAKIKSVEKGNADKPVEKPVTAFTCDVYGQNVKLLLKGDTAKVVYDRFLKDGKTKGNTLTESNVSVDKQVYVSFSADIREIRTGKTSSEVVCQNPTNLQFTFDYLVL
jgi:hypothetical protein